MKKYLLILPLLLPAALPQMARAQDTNIEIKKQEAPDALVGKWVGQVGGDAAEIIIAKDGSVKLTNLATSQTASAIFMSADGMNFIVDNTQSPPSALKANLVSPTNLTLETNMGEIVGTLQKAAN